MRNIVFYLAAWSEMRKYSNIDEYLGFEADEVASTDNAGFFKCKTGVDTAWCKLRIAIQDTTLKYGVKLSPVVADLDKDTWNHFWK